MENKQYWRAVFIFGRIADAEELKTLLILSTFQNNNISSFFYQMPLSNGYLTVISLSNIGLN